MLGFLEHSSTPDRSAYPTCPTPWAPPDNVDAFVEDADVAEDRASAGCVEVLEQPSALPGFLCAVDGVGPQVGDSQVAGHLAGGAGKGLGEGVGGGNAVVEDQDAPQVVVGDGSQYRDVEGRGAQSVVVAGACGWCGEDGA